MPLKAEQLTAHKAYQKLDWDLPPAREGRAEVAKGRSGGPFKLKWEVHGEGSTKLVVSPVLITCCLWGVLRGFSM